MKELIDSGIIGKPECVWCRHFVSYGGDAYFRDWHSERKNTTGLLLQKGAHDIDVIDYLVSSYPFSVSGMGKLSIYDKCKKRPPEIPPDIKWDDNQWPPEEEDGFSQIIDVEDHNMIMFELANRVQAAYLQCHYTPDAERNYTVIGSRGRIENIGDTGKAEIHVWTTSTSRRTPDIIFNLPETNPAGHGGAGNMILEKFFKYVSSQTLSAPVSPVDARQAVAAGVLGHLSMRTTGERFAIPLLPPLERRSISRLKETSINWLERRPQS